MMTLPDFKEKQLIWVSVQQGEILRFKNDNLCVEGRDGKFKLQLSGYRIFLLILSGPVQVTGALLQKAQKFGFSLVLLTYGLRYYGLWPSGAEGNVLLRKKQYTYEGLEISRFLIQNKIRGQIKNLYGMRDESSKEALKKLEKYYGQVSQCLKNDTLLGVEGTASRLYFQVFFRVCDWTARRPRVKHDCINVLLDIGYTYLFCFVEALLRVYGFDIYYGVYHRVFYQRKSLVCDLVEPFRPLIDRTIRKAWNLNQIHREDFYCRQKQFFLKREASSHYSRLFLEILLEYKQEIFIYIQQYYRVFMKGKPFDGFPLFERK